jgi:hypothetical protein
MGADVLAIAHKERYLRGRTREELDLLLRDGAERVGVTEVTSYDSEVECLAGLVAEAWPGDVVGLMTHAQREEVYAWIAEHGGTPDSPEALGTKVRSATALPTVPEIQARLERGLAWVVFEPDGPELWARVRGSVEEFLLGLWRQGLLVGDRPEEAFFVRCDASTMTQNDLDNGRLVVEIGLATVRPAEFVIVRIGQWTASATPDESGC